MNASKESALYALSILICICLLYKPIYANKTDPRIVGGYKTTVRNVPYIVQLRHYGAFICGGSLIRSNAVVTAAHCVYGGNGRNFKVVGGATYLSGGGGAVVRNVNMIILSPLWNPKTLDNDVAVLRLSSPLVGKYIKTIGLCSAPVGSGMTVKVSGWGLTSQGGKTSNQLRSINIPTVSYSRCQQVYGRLTRSMMCAAEAGTKDACNGDSGGPLVHRKQLCGIVSWGIGCAVQRYPGVYTDVYTMRSFIINALKKYF